MKRRVESIPCHVALARLWQFIDGELEPDSADEVRRHIEICERCYPLFDFQHAYFRLMSRLSAHPSPAALRERVIERLALESGPGAR